MNISLSFTLVTAFSDKTKATAKGSPVGTRENKSITNNATFAAGGQCNQSGSVRCHNCEALSFDEYSLRYFSRAKEHGANRSDSCSFFLRRLFRAGDVFSVDSSLVIVCACKAMRRSTSHHGADGCYSFYGVREAKADRYRFLGEINRRGYLSRNASSANRFGLVRGEGLSKDSRSRRTFSRWRSSMDNAISCNSSFVIVCTRKAVRCSTSYHSAGIFYGCNLRDDSGRFATHCININNVMLLCAFKENAGIFRTNFSRNTSDHLSKKAAYTEVIPYKTGIGRRNPFNQYKATQARPASFFVSCHRATIPSGKARTVSMVALVGQPKGWPVSLYAGIPTPASVTALYERRNSSGDSLKQYKEAFHMAISARPYFVWRFIAVGASEHQIIHVTAWTEREARNRCPSGCVAVFAAKIRQEASHG
ncbi:host cell division inhibitor Icd-like protein [Escherichia coli]